MNADIAVARWSLGYLTSKELPEVAVAWLEAGLDSPMMRILAGEPQPIMSEVGPMFERVLAELDIRVPSQPEAALRLARHIAQEILSGIKTPYSGATEIYMLSLDCEEVDVSLIFDALTSEFEDFESPPNLNYYGEAHCQQTLKKIEARIREEARKILL